MEANEVDKQRLISKNETNMRTSDSNQIPTKSANSQDAVLSCVVESTVLEWLMKNGFSKCYGMTDYDCVKRIHVLHSLYWSDNLKHFAIGVLNESGKKGAAGRVENIHYTLIPKPIYTVSDAKKLIYGIT